MVKIELFVSPTCQHCHVAKKILESVLSRLNSDKIEFELVDIKTREGVDKAKLYHISEVPTLLVDGDFMSAGFEEWKVAKLIDMKLNPKRSFWQKLFGGA
jgi:glutaredoxin